MVDSSNDNEHSIHGSCYIPQVLAKKDKLSPSPSDRGLRAFDVVACGLLAITPACGDLGVGTRRHAAIKRDAA